MRNWRLIIASVCMVVGAGLAGLGFGSLVTGRWEDKPPKIVEVHPNAANLELIAHGDGLKVYKVTDKRAIVPFFIVEGRNGQLAIR